MLFSEPKIPQRTSRLTFKRRRTRFSALQRAENSSTYVRPLLKRPVKRFSALQRAENSSMLPYHVAFCVTHLTFQCSSASRKFLNQNVIDPSRSQYRFQCSSASRKFLNRLVDGHMQPAREFQCSSASRKFLNALRARGGNERPSVSVLFSEPKIPQYLGARVRCAARQRFSALQRAENSSISVRRTRSARCQPVSVLFSEPKIPQFKHRLFQPAPRFFLVSVLFSEPKIPQSLDERALYCVLARFSALQRAENSSIRSQTAPCAAHPSPSFSALQRAENSSIVSTSRTFGREYSFSALQRAENSSIKDATQMMIKLGRFSALQRAENSSIFRHWNDALGDAAFQCSSASRKFLNIDTGQGPP